MNDSRRDRTSQRAHSRPELSVDIYASKQNFLRVIEPLREGEWSAEDMLGWVHENRAFIESALLENGGIYFRGFKFSPRDFRSISDCIYPLTAAMDYRGGFAIRERADHGLYNATATSKRINLAQHHEMSYLDKKYAPTRIFFYCSVTADTGGETPLCSNRAFMKRLSGTIASKFREKKVMYRRVLRKEKSQFHTGWRQSFGTDDRRAVEAFCRERSMEFEWKDDDVLIVRHIAQGLTVHDVTGEELWFNHGYTVTVNTGTPGRLPPNTRWTYANAPEKLDMLRQTLLVDYPINAYYGDGSFIEESVLDEIHAIYLEERVTFPWQVGDFVVLDNLLTSHGRNAYEGDQRSVLVTWR